MKDNFGHEICPFYVFVIILSSVSAFSSSSPLLVYYDSASHSVRDKIFSDFMISMLLLGDMSVFFLICYISFIQVCDLPE